MIKSNRTPNLPMNSYSNQNAPRRIFPRDNHRLGVTDKHREEEYKSMNRSLRTSTVGQVQPKAERKALNRNESLKVLKNSSYNPESQEDSHRINFKTSSSMMDK